MEETEFTENYPLTHSYLSDNMTKLMNRDKGKNEKYKWFAWGRNQGVNDTKGNKIVISTIFESNPFIVNPPVVLIPVNVLSPLKFDLLFICVCISDVIPVEYANLEFLKPLL